MNEIENISYYSPKSARLRISNRLVAKKSRPGQFVIIKFSSDGLRIPFSIVASDEETGLIDVIIHRGEGLDDILKDVIEGSVLPDLLGPLGQPAVLVSDKKILFCGDGAGLVPLLPLIKESHKLGNKVFAIISEQSSLTKCLVGDIINDCDMVEMAPGDEICSLVKERISKNGIDKIIMSGPTEMMRDISEIAKNSAIPADCVLNMLMIDGIGICGVCRVMVNGVQKNTCVDGPVFNAWDVDFNQILNRQRSYK